MTEPASQESYYLATMRNIPGFIYRGYADGSVDFFEPYDMDIKSLTGHDREEFTSRRLKWTDLVVSEDLASLKGSVREALSTGRSFVREYRIRDRAGNIKWIQDRGQIILDEDGRIDHIVGIFFDTTYVKEMEEELKQQKEEQHARELVRSQDYKAFIEGMTNYVIAVNKNFQVIFANQLFQREFSYTPGVYCFQAWKNQEEPCKNCLVASSFQDGRIHTSEETQHKRNGTEAQFLVKSTPVKNEEGEVVYVFETATDITEQRRLEREIADMSGRLDELVSKRIIELKEHEERYRSLFERSLDTILVIDRRGGLIEINSAGLRMLGFEFKDDALAAGDISWVFEDPDDFRELLSRLNEQGFATDFEVRIKSREKGVRNVLISGSLMSDERGRLNHYCAIFRDITALRKRKLELVRSNLELSALNSIALALTGTLELEGVLDTIVSQMHKVLGPDTIRVYLMDEPGENLILYTRKRVSESLLKEPGFKMRRLGEGYLGKAALQEEATLVDILEETDTPYSQVLLDQGVMSAAYIPIRSKGKPLGVLVVCSFEREKFSPESVGFLTSIGSQMGVAVENAKLYESMRQAYQRLEAAQEQLIQSTKLASLGKLSAIIAHEINNPLAAILTYTKLMKKQVEMRRLGDEDLARTKRHLDMVSTETARCGEIVKNLLAFSRESRVEMRSTRIDLVLEKALALISHDLGLKQIEVVKETDPDIPEVVCDFKQIQQALLNVLANASEAMDEGGTLTLKVSREDSEVVISITDTGPGIPRKNLGRIFEPFFTTKSEGQGVGLGLSVVYGIISRHEGSVDVASPPPGAKRGSRFTIRLPLDDGGEGGEGSALPREES